MVEADIEVDREDLTELSRSRSRQSETVVVQKARVKYTRVPGRFGVTVLTVLVSDMAASPST